LSIKREKAAKKNLCVSHVYPIAHPSFQVSGCKKKKRQGSGFLSALEIPSTRSYCQLDQNQLFPARVQYRAAD